MEEAWRQWLRENHPEYYQDCIKSIAHNCGWRDKEIERLAAELAEAKQEADFWHKAAERRGDDLKKAYTQLSNKEAKVDKDTTEVILSALHKSNPRYSYCITEEHWHFYTDRQQSEFILSLCPEAPAKVEQRRFQSETELIEYINLLVGDKSI